MRIFNEEKTEEILNPDLSLGRLIPDVLIIHHEAIPEVEQKSHFVVIAEYPNGGQDLEEIIDVPYQPYVEAYDETEDIMVYKLYTELELKKRKIVYQIQELENKLFSTDYIVIKMIESSYNSKVEINDDYEEKLLERNNYRTQISKLKDELKNIQ